MQFDKGLRLGPYTIVSLLGAGGMGEVYEAHDTRLGRGVALKVVLQSLLANSDGRARFDREARALAALNHPNIATLHGVDECDGQQLLVMELVHGETLADRLRQGALPVADAIEIARQIAEALEAAHARGIVHRDLKPANVKITADGTVKLLDFGLATALRPTTEGAITGVTAPTMVGATQEGMLLGTAAYMSPEQARGLTVDHRSDVFAFGSVLYEMLTGRPPFAGATLGDLLAAVLTREPDYTALPPTIDPRLAALVRRCLDKAPRRRWQAMGDVRHELEAIAESPLVAGSGTLPAQVGASRRPTWHWLLFAAACALLAGAFAAGSLWSSPTTARPQVSRFVHTLTEVESGIGTSDGAVLAVSPDGLRVAFAANQQMYVRELGKFEAAAIPGASDRQTLATPAFSPDGRSLVFFSGTAGERGLRRIEVTGGTPALVCLTPAPWGLSWHGDHLLFATSEGIMRVSANGGTPEVLVRLPRGEVAYGPQLLPGGTEVLYSVAKEAVEDRWAAGQVVVQTIGSDERTVVVTSGAKSARYLPTGHVIYASEGVIMAIPFDLDGRRALGPAVPVVQGVTQAHGDRGAVQFAVSDTGTLVFIPGPASKSATRLHLAVFDHAGGMTPLGVPPGPYAQPRISRDGRQIAYSSGEGPDVNIWVVERPGTSSPRQLTFGGGTRHPVWAADGTRVFFQSNRDGARGIAWQRADGSRPAEQLTRPQPGIAHIPQSASPDGTHLLYDAVTNGHVSLQLLSLSDRTPAPFGAVTSRVSTGAMFSPDGRWVAYTEREAQTGVYVQPFPATGAKYLISTSDNAFSANDPVWSPDGHELFYTPGQGPRLQRVSLATTQSPVRFTSPADHARRFLNLPPAFERPYDVMPDGRFLGLIDVLEASSTGAAAPSRLHVVLNWFEELRAIAPPH